jgi:hypothetical protein
VPPRPASSYLSSMAERPIRFEHTRWLGDKRNQVAHDVDACDDQSVIDDIVQAEVGLSFGPDTLAEARNRGYRPHPSIREAEPAADAPA